MTIKVCKCGVVGYQIISFGFFTSFVMIGRAFNVMVGVVRRLSISSPIIN